MLALTVLAVGLTAAGDPVQEADAKFAASVARPTISYAEAYRLTEAGIKLVGFIPDHPWGPGEYETYLRDGVPSSRAKAATVREVRSQPVFIQAPCPTGT